MLLLLMSWCRDLRRLLMLARCKAAGKAAGRVLSRLLCGCCWLLAAGHGPGWLLSASGKILAAGKVLDGNLGRLLCCCCRLLVAGRGPGLLVLVWRWNQGGVLLKCCKESRCRGRGWDGCYAVTAGCWLRGRMKCLCRRRRAGCCDEKARVGADAARSCRSGRFGRRDGAWL